MKVKQLLLIILGSLIGVFVLAQNHYKNESGLLQERLFILFCWINWI